MSDMYLFGHEVHGEQLEKSVYVAKRRIQIALRRFILSEAGSYKYSRFFGATKVEFRDWMEMQFVQDMEWTNYGYAWDIDHRVPVCYFNILEDEECRVAYNFLNIRPSIIGSNRNKAQRVDVGYFRSFFSTIFEKTCHPVAKKLLQRIDFIDKSTEITAKQIRHIRSILETEKNRPTADEIIADMLNR